MQRWRTVTPPATKRRGWGRSWTPLSTFHQPVARREEPGATRVRREKKRPECFIQRAAVFEHLANTMLNVCHVKPRSLGSGDATRARGTQGREARDLDLPGEKCVGPKEATESGEWERQEEEKSTDEGSVQERCTTGGCTGGNSTGHDQSRGEESYEQTTPHLLAHASDRRLAPV